jgi:hypothetical protein
VITHDHRRPRLHMLGAVVWVGGMFAIYVCLRPALDRRSACGADARHLPEIPFPGYGWRSCCCSPAATGCYSRPSAALLVVWPFHGPWQAFERAVDVEDWSSASATLDQHPPDHRCQPAARPASRRHRRQWALLGLTLSRTAFVCARPVKARNLNGHYQVGNGDDEKQFDDYWTALYQSSY